MGQIAAGAEANDAQQPQVKCKMMVFVADENNAAWTHTHAVLIITNPLSNQRFSLALEPHLLRSLKACLSVKT